jgi:PucR family transcriptional regulator, purine catabolism regulatory protein
VLTVSDVLELPIMRRGLPEVVSGESHLDREVRWAHVLDVAEVGGLLRGGEFVLNNGFGIGLESQAQRSFIRELHGQEVAAVAVELGLLYRNELPAPMVAAAKRVELPLIALHRKTRFVEVTEAVHERLMGSDFVLLRRSDELAQRLTDAMLAGGEVPDLLHEIARTLGNPAVLEDASRRVVAMAIHQSSEDVVLRAWQDCLEAESRADENIPGTVEAPIRLPNGPWGRLLVLEIDSPLDELAPIAVTRGADALALHLMSRHQVEELAAHSSGELLGKLAAGRMTEQQGARRASALGFEPRSSTLLSLAAAWRDPRSERTGTGWAALTAEIRGVFRRAGMSSLIGPRRDQLLIVVNPGHEGEPPTLIDEAVDGVMTAADRHQLDHRDLALAVGPLAANWLEAGLAVDRAAKRAAVAATEPPRRWHDARRVTLNDVVHELASSHTLQAYVHDHLGPLLSLTPDRRRTEMLETLETYLRHAGRKTSAAGDLHLERQSLYHRLDKLRELLGVDWRDGEELLELHFALRARRFLDKPGARSSQ